MSTSTLREPRSEADFQTLICRVVGLMRDRRATGVEGVLAPILAERNEYLSTELSSDGAALLQTYDRLILGALSMRYDELDMAVGRTSFAVAEVDGQGAVCYANDALKAMLPDVLGREFAELFGPRSHDVRNALASQKPETLRLDLQRGNLPSIHLRGEIGPLRDEHNRIGAYALLLDVEGERARWDASPDGILRLDPGGNVVFANKAAKGMFGDNAELLHGRSVFQLFGARNSAGSTVGIENWLQSEDGHKEVTDVRRLDGHDPVPVRLTIVPSFDTSASRSGWILTVVPMAEELVQSELQRLLSIPDCEPEYLLRGIMQAIRTILPYDLATFGVYTTDMKHHNTLVVHPEPEWKWTTAWFPLGPGVSDFLLGGQTWGDIEETADRLAPDLHDDQVMANILASKLKRFVTLPITGGGKNVRAALTLLSKDGDQYDGHEVALMRELGVERALLVAEANLVRAQDSQIRELENRLAAAREYQELAGELASGIARCFKWDYVAVFSVDRQRNLFRLIYQHNETASPDVDPAYVQDLSEGLLGAALRENAPRVEANIGADTRHGYKAVVPGRRSALAMPIRVVRQADKPASDEIEWLLSIESDRRNAFQGPNMDALVTVLAQCEGILRQRWHKAVQVSLLDAVEQAVIVLDRAGRVRLSNRWANTLLHRGGDGLLGQLVEKFGAEEADRSMLRSTSLLAQGRVMLSAGDGLIVPTLATRLEVNDDYRHQLLLLTDLREQEQQSDWGYLEQTVNEVAQNARRPLMLAVGAVSEVVGELLGETSIKDKLKQVIRNLDKADITYERLANTLSVRQEPDRPAQIFDAIETLKEAVVELPDDDVTCCEVGNLDFEPFRRFRVLGWPDQLKFAFRSLLGHLLLYRPNDAMVGLSLFKTTGGNLHVRFSIPATQAKSAAEDVSDRISVAERRAREAASLASDAVAAAIDRHRGTFSIDTRDSTVIAFDIELQPASPTM